VTEDLATQIVLDAVVKAKYRKANIAAQEHLLDFCEATYSGYHRAAHLELVAEALEEIERGGNDRLIVEMPPRH